MNRIVDANTISAAANFVPYSFKRMIFFTMIDIDILLD